MASRADRSLEIAIAKANREKVRKKIRDIRTAMSGADKVTKAVKNIDLKKAQVQLADLNKTIKPRRKKKGGGGFFS